jgi:FtsH-binding integral membrane protein
MAYVPGVKNDLFISYAHVDNEPDAHNIRWVSEFVRGFGLDVRQRLGGPKDFTPFFDQSDLHAHHHLQILLENARQSAIFLAVLSPSYVAHDWTMKELKAFAEIAGDTRRIIVVEKLPLEGDEPYPDEIAQHKRTSFWRRDEPESHTPSTLTAGTSAQYRQILESLGHQVQQLLREMRRDAERQKRASVEQMSRKEATAEAERSENEKRDQEARVQAQAARQQPEIRERDAQAKAEAERQQHELREREARESAEAARRQREIRERQAREIAEAECQQREGDNDDPGAAPPLMFELLWPKTETNEFTRALAALTAVGVVSFAICWGARSAMLANIIPAFIALLALGVACLHVMAVSLGAGLGALGATIATGAMLSAMMGQIPEKSVPAFVILSGGMILSACVLGALAERGWGRGYWCCVAATALACIVFVAGFVVGSLTVEDRYDRIPGNVVILCAVAAGFSVIASGVTWGIWRWLTGKRLTQPPSPPPVLTG